MAGKVMNKMMEMLGMNDDNEEIEDVEEQVASDIEEEDISLEPFMSNKKPNKVVNIHTAASTKVVISKPDDYSEAVNICDNLKNRKIVVVNTASLEPKIGQKLLDFISGASYALDGDIQQVEKGVYILSPSNVEVSNDLKNELSSKGIFNWNK